jgi:hypothetical protein
VGVDAVAAHRDDLDTVLLPKRRQLHASVATRRMLKAALQIHVHKALHTPSPPRPARCNT